MEKTEPRHKPRQCVKSLCRRSVANGRNCCERCAEPCWCPCKCGCKEPNDRVNPSGLCPDCEEGNHEIPCFVDLIERLLPLYEGIVANAKAKLRMLQLEQQIYKRYEVDDLRWDGKEIRAYGGNAPMCAADPDTSVRARDLKVGSPERQALQELTRAYRKAERTGMRLIRFA